MSGFDKDRIYTSKSLHEELNAERARQGKSQIPVINPCKGGSANSLARKDKSWSSVPDFFVKLFKKRGSR